MRALTPGESLAHVSGFGLSSQHSFAEGVRVVAEKRGLRLYQPDLVTDALGFSFVKPIAVQARDHKLQLAIRERAQLFVTHSKGAFVLEEAFQAAMGSQKADEDQQLVVLAPSLSSEIGRLEAAIKRDPTKGEQHLAQDFGGIAMILHGIDGGPEIAVAEDYVEEITDPDHNPIQHVGSLANRFAQVCVVFAGCDSRLGSQEAELTLLRQQIDHPVQAVTIPGALHTFRNKGEQVIDRIVTADLYADPRMEMWMPEPQRV